jgi:hypothetical protein
MVVCCDEHSFQVPNFGATKFLKAATLTSLSSPSHPSTFFDQNQTDIAWTASDQTLQHISRQSEMSNDKEKSDKDASSDMEDWLKPDPEAAKLYELRKQHGIFSVASRLISLRRTRLDPQIAGKTLFVAQNWKWFEDRNKS